MELQTTTISLPHHECFTTENTHFPYIFYQLHLPNHLTLLYFYFIILFTYNKFFTHTHTHTHTYARAHTHTHTHTHVLMYIYMKHSSLYKYAFPPHLHVLYSLIVYSPGIIINCTRQ